MSESAALWPALISAGSGLLGALIGGAIGLFSQWWASRNTQTILRKSLAAALAGEIGAYLNIVERRRHVQHAQELLDAARAGNRVILRDWLLSADEGLLVFRL